MFYVNHLSNRSCVIDHAPPSGYTRVIFISNGFISNQAQFLEILLYNDVIVIT